MNKKLGTSSLRVSKKYKKLKKSIDKIYLYEYNIIRLAEANSPELSVNTGENDEFTYRRDRKRISR